MADLIVSQIGPKWTTSNSNGAIGRIHDMFPLSDIWTLQRSKNMVYFKGFHFFLDPCYRQSPFMVSQIAPIMQLLLLVDLFGPICDTIKLAVSKKE